MGQAVYPKVCGARKKRGGICKAPAGRGTPHPGYGSCSLHGGNTKTGEIAGARYEAKAELACYGGTVDLEPHEALLLCIRMAAGEVQSATEHVERLNENELLEHPEELLQRPLREARGAEEPRIVVQETRRRRAQLNVWIRIRQDAMDRLVRYSAAALIKAATAEYRDESNQLRDWLEACTEAAVGASTPFGDLRENYLSYAKGEQIRAPLKPTKFGTALTEAGFPGGKSTGVRVRHGIRLTRRGDRGGLPV